MHFAIRSKGDPRFCVWLRDCSRGHAEIVLGDISGPGFPAPDDLRLEEVEHLYDLAPAKRKRWWRLRRRG